MVQNIFAIDETMTYRLSVAKSVSTPCAYTLLAD